MRIGWRPKRTAGKDGSHRVLERVGYPNHVFRSWRRFGDDDDLGPPLRGAELLVSRPELKRPKRHGESTKSQGRSSADKDDLRSVVLEETHRGRRRGVIDAATRCRRAREFAGFLELVRAGAADDQIAEVLTALLGRALDTEELTRSNAVRRRSCSAGGSCASTGSVIATNSSAHFLARADLDLDALAIRRFPLSIINSTGKATESTVMDQR